MGTKVAGRPLPVPPRLGGGPLGTPWAVPLLLWPLEGWAGPEGPPPVDLWAEGLRIIGYLLILMVLGLLATQLAKRLQPKLGSGPIRLVGGRNLAPGVGVRLIQVGSRGWLIGVTRERVTLLAELGEEELRAVREEGP